MIFHRTDLAGAFVIEPERVEDKRGFFARSFCEREFRAHGLTDTFVQCSISFNRRRGTLRGMHFQSAPHEESRVVRCTVGAIHDVIIDLRPSSPTFKRWFSIDLTAKNRLMLFVPTGFAHGFQTLEDNTEILYQISEFYHPECARGIRWDDPAFSIQWPSVAERVMSQRDQRHGDFEG